MANEQLHAAKNAKNDEFYTRLVDVSKELSNYGVFFNGKVVLCNCDDPEWSNFWIYFHQNFEDLGLKKLISTHYNVDGSPSYKMEYEGGNDIDVKCWKQTALRCNGDFRSEECVEILKEADICVTNPPFSIAREYFIPLLIEHKKDFVIIGDLNWITYKGIFPLIKANKIFMGYNSVKEFNKPDGSVQTFGNKLWYTNLKIDKLHDSLVDTLQYQYSRHLDWYTKYDNYDAINVDKVERIPYDYMGVMGVPITFLNKYNPDEFEIIGLGIANLGLECGVQPYKAHHKKYRKEIQKRGTVDGDLYMVDDNDHPVVPYARILIKRKK